GPFGIVARSRPASSARLNKSSHPGGATTSNSSASEVSRRVKSSGKSSNQALMVGIRVRSRAERKLTYKTVPRQRHRSSIAFVHVVVDDLTEMNYASSWKRVRAKSKRLGPRT